MRHHLFSGLVVGAGMLLGSACGGRVEALEGAGGAPPDAAFDAAPSTVDAAPVVTRDASPDVAVRDAAPPLGTPGAACALPTDCAASASPHAGLNPGPCIAGAPLGWSGGYCIDFCVLPEDPFVLPRLARSTCPSGAVCLPRWERPLDPRGDIGACLKECEVDGDCRESEGYYCRHDFSFSPALTFTNGYCAPSHCKTRGCRRSYVCGC